MLAGESAQRPSSATVAALHESHSVIKMDGGVPLTIEAETLADQAGLQPAPPEQDSLGIATNGREGFFDGQARVSALQGRHPTVDRQEGAPR